MNLIGKRIRVKQHALAPLSLIGQEGVVQGKFDLEPTDDDVLRVLRDDGSMFFVPVDAVEEIA